MSKNLDFHLQRMSLYPEGHGHFSPVSRLWISDIGAVGRLHMRTTTKLLAWPLARAGARFHASLPGRPRGPREAQRFFINTAIAYPMEA